MPRRNLSIESFETRNLMAVDVFMPIDSLSTDEVDPAAAQVDYFLKLEDSDPAAAQVDYFQKVDEMDEADENSLIGLLLPAGREPSSEQYFEYKLEDVIISSYQRSSADSAASDLPLESLSLNYEEIKF